MGIGNILTVRHLDQNPSYLYLSNIESLIKGLPGLDSQSLSFKYEEVETPPRAHHQLYRMCMSCKNFVTVNSVKLFLDSLKIEHRTNGVTQLVIEAKLEKFDAYAKYPKDRVYPKTVQSQETKPLQAKVDATSTLTIDKHKPNFRKHRKVSLSFCKDISEELSFINVMLRENGMLSKIIERKGSVIGGVLKYICKAEDALLFMQRFLGWGYNDNEVSVGSLDRHTKMVTIQMRHRKLDPYPGKARKKE